MHHDPRRIIARAERLLAEKVRPATEAAVTPLATTVVALPGEPEPFAQATARPGARTITPGERWGPPWTTSWFHVTGHVPAHWPRRRDPEGPGPAYGPVTAVVDLGFEPETGPGFQCEGLVHAADGRVLKGVHPRSQWVEVDPAESAVDLWVEGAANPNIVAQSFRPTRLGDGLDAGGPPLYTFRRADLVLYDPLVQALEYDLDVLVGWARRLPADRPRRARVLAALSRACDAVDLDDVAGTAAAARAALAPVLAAPAEPSAHRLAAVGHAHIDSAWLWPLREAARKVARTFANVADLMDRYPEFVFAGSQAQQYAWLEEQHPDVFDKVKAAVASGRWAPAGGMWVESDTNLPGGEALVRQFTFGKRFFRDRFGVEAREVWLPDSFGYTAALPQIAALAGHRWFLTQKLRWGATNDFPHHTFRWQGIDGTTLYSHVPPVDTYLAEMVAAELDHAVANFRDHPVATRSVVPFGHGDGGGGPTAVMLERARRQADLEGSPAIDHRTPEAFFLEAEAENPRPPVWVGELYLEAHRGTYTSHAALKQGNRRSEHLLREAELWSATAAVRSGFAYPHDRLDRLWEQVLLNQFHDILPGSSIGWVNRQAEEAYAAVTSELEDLVGAAVAALAGDGTAPLGFNAMPVPSAGVPALGAAGPVPVVGPVAVAEADGETVVDNGAIRVVIGRDGLISSLVDLGHGREVVVPGGRLDQLVVYQDQPNEYDAWDLDEHYRGPARPLTGVDSATWDRGADGSVTVTVRRHFGRSRAEQRTTVRPKTAAVDFTTTVDWHEANRLLKARFAVDVLADQSSSEIQFGHVRRPTHANTTWDAVKFEICAHRWVHVGEAGFGVAVANDSTYGHDVHRLDGDGRPGTSIGLSLLRAPQFPDPATDQGRHSFSYRLVAGADVAAAVQAGYELNVPVRVVAGAGPVAPLVAVDGPGVLVESVKLADDRSGDVVVRLYESLGGRATARVTWSFAVARAVVADLLERELEPSSGTDSAELAFRPFQIITLRLTRA